MGARATAVMAWLALALLALPAPAQELRGHGGPVRALAVSPDGQLAISGSFDQSVILWRLGAGAAEAVLRFHEGSVNAVLALTDGRFASAGEDGRIAIWHAGQPDPERVLAGHTGPIVALAQSPDGGLIASASWDGTARVAALADDAAPRTLEGHTGNVNGVAFLPDGTVVTSGYDATLRFWPVDRSTPSIVTLPAVLNAVVASADGIIAVAGGDGVLRFVRAGVVTSELEIAQTPLVALAITRDGKSVAAAGIRGNVAIIDVAAKAISASLVGPGLPVWSLAFTADGRQLLSGGADRLVRRWDARTGEHMGEVVPRAPTDLLTASRNPDTERGALVFRACAACHTLTTDDGNRAGPTLHGVFGRRIASLPGYNFSVALRNMDIVWNSDTIAKLFEIGPSAYTPGTKMPEQIITSTDDRKALVEWLEKATR